VSFDEIAQVVRTLFGSATEVSDELFKLYEQGKGKDGPCRYYPRSSARSEAARTSGSGTQRRVVTVG
jgi:hypothetical protein